MTTELACLLVHGYLGDPADLAPLAEGLAQDPRLQVETLCLPGHASDITPGFDETDFLRHIAAAIDRQRAAGRGLALIGHSTGGNLLLAEIARRLETDPASLDGLRLLVLCATPTHIDLGYAQRWQDHLNCIATRHQPALHDIGALAALVNRQARRPALAVPAPVLLVHGEDDELVPATDQGWTSTRLATPLRRIGIAGASHHLFSGAGADLAVDHLRRALRDAAERHAVGANEDPTLHEWVPGLPDFIAAWPDSRLHLSRAPAARRALQQTFIPAPQASSEPTLANIEITTRCNLGCAACARTQLKRQSRFMSQENFQRVLQALPHALRINLVGLGEPLLHPQVVEFVRLAVASGRRVGLVTNAMPLDAELARELCAAGLASITFSLDAVEQSLAERLRAGSDMALIHRNIQTFMAERQRQGVTLLTAAFCALSADNLDEFEAIVDFAADLGLDAVMVSDLNFPANQARSVHHHLTPEHARNLRRALKQAVSRRLPVLSVWGLEEYALDRQYLDYLLLRAEPLAQRATRHSHCLSPWQTIPVNVDGQLTLCDCQPDAVIGELFHTPQTDWWNGPAMRAHRQRMLGDNPPPDCLACPRF